MKPSANVREMAKIAIIIFTFRGYCRAGDEVITVEYLILERGLVRVWSTSD